MMKRSALGLSLLLCTFGASAETVVEGNNGVVFKVPDNWEVTIHPKGFNNAPYNKESNPKGILPGYGGWPGYTTYLDSLKCTSGGLVISPAVSCPPTPVVLETTCFYEPPIPEIPEECQPGLHISPYQPPEYCKEWY